MDHYSLSKQLSASPAVRWVSQGRQRKNVPQSKSVHHQTDAQETRANLLSWTPELGTREAR